MSSPFQASNALTAPRSAPRRALGAVRITALSALACLAPGPASAAIPPVKVSGERMGLNARQSVRAGKRIIGSWAAVGARVYKRGHYITQELRRDSSAGESWLFLDGGGFRHISAQGVQRKGRWLVHERLIVRTATDPHQSVAVVLDVPITAGKPQVESTRRIVRKLLEGLPGGHIVGLMDVGGDQLDWSGLEDDRSQVLQRLSQWQPRPGGNRLYDGLAAAAQFLMKSPVDGPARILMVSAGQDGGSRLSADGALDFLRRANVRLDTSPVGQLSPTQEAHLERMANHAGGMYGPVRDVGPSTSTGPSRRFTIVRVTDVRITGSLVPRSDLLLLTTFIDDGRKLVVHEAKAYPDWSAALRRGSVLAPGIYGK